jgi:predicted dehydrogenase
MNPITRRAFLEESMIAAGVAAASSAAVPLVEAEEDRRRSANETIRHAVIGCRIRGRQHASGFAKLPHVEIAYVCDPDSQLVNELATAVEKQQGRRPKAVADLRTIFDDKSVDTVSIAAPNHWHALAAIWAMQAGKDVYVEKPVSHNVSEGRRIVQVARKTNRICQAGTQNRSRGDLAEAAQFLRAGKLGKVTFARSIMYRPRTSIGPAGRFEPPPQVDFNLWLGPATNKIITRQHFHYDWHWFWDTGNGELGNNNIHVIDICRWLMGLEGFGDSVLSLGTRTFGDAGETPNTQIVVHTFGPVTIVQEVRNLKSDPFSKKFRAGHVIYGSEGFIAEGSLFDPQGKLVKTFKAPGQNHFANFIGAVRSRRREDLTAEILEGHASSAMCHVGNISYRLGATATPEAIRAVLKGPALHPDVRKTFERTLAHLEGHKVDLAKTPFHLGPPLAIDAKAETFVDNNRANALLTRKYRKPFVVPSEKEV